jgi:adenylate cyclase
MASGAVVAQASDAITFRPLGSAQAKGRATALEIYEVLSARRVIEAPQSQAPVASS